jgi:hypothetical protein
MLVGALARLRLELDGVRNTCPPAGVTAAAGAWGMAPVSGTSRIVDGVFM